MRSSGNKVIAPPSTCVGANGPKIHFDVGGALVFGEYSHWRSVESYTQEMRFFPGKFPEPREQVIPTISIDSCTISFYDPAGNTITDLIHVYIQKTIAPTLAGVFRFTLKTDTLHRCGGCIWCRVRYVKTAKRTTKL